MDIQEKKQALIAVDAWRNTSFNAEEIRWNIFFDDIPNQERREKLKRNGFKWSPRRQAWTRGAKTMSENYLKKYVLEIGD